MRLIHFALSQHLEEMDPPGYPAPEQDVGLSINVSSTGLCMLTAQCLEEGKVLRIWVPMPVAAAQTPTLADVRWVRALPSSLHGGFVVGLRFML